MQLNKMQTIAPKTDITSVMVEEHQLILRMITLLEKSVALAEAGQFSDWNFYLEGALPFIRSYADRFHHAKEEDVLFKALVANGMPEKNSPVAAMLMEHDHGRAFVRGVEGAAQRLLAGENAVAELAENARGYCALLRDHIEKEDTILYPLAERILPEAVRPDMIAAYAAADVASPELEATFRRLVEGYEAKRAA